MQTKNKQTEIDVIDNNTVLGGLLLLAICLTGLITLFIISL